MGLVSGKHVVGSPMGVSFSKKVKFIFPDFLIKKPLLYEMSKLYHVITNIEKANIDETEGWVIMRVKGTGAEIDKALQWIADKGVLVQIMFSDF